MKKKILAIVLCVAMLAIAIVGGTMAYFTDKDAKTNVMVVGNVAITQNETDREGTAVDTEFDLIPAVYYDENGKVYNPTTVAEGPKQDFTGSSETLGAYADAGIENEVDKFVTVTNDGSEAVYVRTIFLWENTADNKLCEVVHGLWGNNDGQYRTWLTDADGNEVQVTIDGVLYSIAVCTYNTKLEPGVTTSPSLKQIWLDPSVDNDWTALLGDSKMNILALSQAVQYEGFETVSATEALDAAFGAVDATNVVDWFSAL